nr:MAG TPA: hypothetical protein [Caudoviricetes sp.]
MLWMLQLKQEIRLLLIQKKEQRLKMVRIF